MSSAGVVYEVNLSVDKDTVAAFKEWLVPHIGDLLALDGFDGAELFEPEAADGEDKALLCVQYRVKTREHLETYFREHAARMRAEGMARFEGKCTATRRVLALVSRHMASTTK